MAGGGVVRETAFFKREDDFGLLNLRGGSMGGYGVHFSNGSFVQDTISKYASLICHNDFIGTRAFLLSKSGFMCS